MPARQFNRAAGDNITTGLGALGFSAGSALSVMALVRPTTGVQLGILSAGTAALGWGLEIRASGVVRIHIDSITVDSVAVAPSGVWVIVGFTKPTAPDVSGAIVHIYNFATGAWVHETLAVGGNPTGNPAVAAPRIGSIYGTVSFEGYIALAAAWNAELRTQAIESLPFGLAPWLGPMPVLGGGGNPRALWVLDQDAVAQAVPDVSGGGANQSAISGTSVATPLSPPWSPGAAVSVN